MEQAIVKSELGQYTRIHEEFVTSFCLHSHCARYYHKDNGKAFCTFFVILLLHIYNFMLGTSDFPLSTLHFLPLRAAH